MPKRAMLAIGGALAALLLLACGDDRLSPEEYFPRVQAIADDVNGTVGAGADRLAAAGADPAASEASLVEAVRAFFVTLADALDAANTDLADLSDSPDGVEDAHAAFAAQTIDLAAAFRDLSDRLADAASFDDLNAVLAPLDPSFGLDAEFLAACEGLERAAADAGQPLDMQCALDLIPEDAFTVADPAAAYFEALQAIADVTNEDIEALAIAYAEAQEAARSAGDLTAAIAAYFRESALVMDAAAQQGGALPPPAAVRAAHDVFLAELGNLASQFGETAWRIDNAGDIDEVNDILESLPESFGRPAEFAAACDALERAAADAGLALELGCGEES